MSVLRPEGWAKILAMSLSTDLTLFLMYHSNSYASNAAMMRSPKPMIMRDVFLTRSSAVVPNPLSFLYVAAWSDALACWAVVWLLALPLATRLGSRQMFALYASGGLLSSFAYQFQSQLGRDKTNTPHDCTCTSHGASAALCALALAAPGLVPTPRRWLAAAFLGRCALDEYVYPRLWRPERRPGEIELTNWGFAGGVCAGLMYATLVLRRRANAGQLRRFYDNLAPAS